jgi:hypothetical protein
MRLIIEPVGGTREAVEPGLGETVEAIDAR